MPSPRFSTRVRHLVRSLAASCCIGLAAVATAAAAQAPVVTFTTGTADAGSPERHEFSLGDRDERILRLVRQADSLRADAERYDRLARLDSERLGDLRGLQRGLAASGGEALEIPAHRWRLAYAEAGAPEAADRLLGGSVERMGRGPLVADADTLSAMITALEELRDTHTDLRELSMRRAATSEARAERLGQQMRAAEADRPVGENAGLDGTWYVLPADDVARARFNAFASAPFDWDGTITAARPATSEQIERVLRDPRITVYEGGRMDIATGRVDGRLLDSVFLLAEQYGQVTLTSLITGHSYYTAGGNVSAHSYGCAADIGTVGGVLIAPSTQGPGSFTEEVVAYLAGLRGDLAPHQVISLSAIGGPTLAMADHHDHIHLGYSC